MSVLRHLYRRGWSSSRSSLWTAALRAKLSQSEQIPQTYGRQNAMLSGPLCGVCNNITGKHVNYTKKSFCTVSIEPEPLIEVLDDYGLRTGKTLSRKEIHELGKVHRAVHFYLFDKSGQLLLQRRSLQKEKYPGLLTISVSGHVDVGESSSTALHREIKEEIGLDPVHMKIHFLFSYRQDYRQDAIVSPSFIDRQFNDVYACIHDFKVDDISFDSNEITEIKLVPFAKFQDMIANEDTDFTPGFVGESADMLYFFSPILQRNTK